MLAAGLCAHGYDAGLLDLSLELYHRVLEPHQSQGPRAAVMRATPACAAGAQGLGPTEYLLHGDGRGGYDAQRHRTAAGLLHKRLRVFGDQHPGWTLTLMDLHPPGSPHDPAQIMRTLQTRGSPFEWLWERVLLPVIKEHRPRRVLLSLAYLAQLPAAIDLARFLACHGIAPVVGGSLPTSLALTGHGTEALHSVFPHIVLGDGRTLAGTDKPLLSRLAWPRMVSDKPYLSSRPIVPVALSTGCYWRRCLFCPDRDVAFAATPTSAIDGLLESMPDDVKQRRPVLHLLDSALPPKLLHRVLPTLSRHGTSFYGFARPEPTWYRTGLLEHAAESGCLMLQLGVESGSGRLLDRFGKGITADDSAACLRRAADAGIRTYLYLLFGLPGESEADRHKTLDFVRAHAGAIDFLNLSLFNLPRTCELTLAAADHGITLLDEAASANRIRLYRPFECDGTVPRVEARRFLQQHFLKDSAARQAHSRTPRWLRAAHLALMNVHGRADAAFG